MLVFSCLSKYFGWILLFLIYSILLLILLSYFFNLFLLFLLFAPVFTPTANNWVQDCVSPMPLISSVNVYVNVYLSFHYCPFLLFLSCEAPRAATGMKSAIQVKSNWLIEVKCCWQFHITYKIFGFRNWIFVQTTIN